MTLVRVGNVVRVGELRWSLSSQRRQCCVAMHTAVLVCSFPKSLSLFYLILLEQFQLFQIVPVRACIEWKVYVSERQRTLFGGAGL
jgi:hypothetical protein